MGTLQTSGAISLSQVQSALGGASPISLSEYYRGGSYVPTTATTTTVNDSGFKTPNANTGLTTYYGWCPNTTYNNTYIRWTGSTVGVVSYTATSATIGGYTYYKGSLYATDSDKVGTIYQHYIKRTWVTTSTVSINTSVPSSGQFSMSQLYGARNP